MLSVTRQYISTHINASFLNRGIALFALLLVFATGLKAQRYYVIYYDDANDNNKRYYLSINADGSGIERTTELSFKNYWMADPALSTAQGSKGIDIYKNNSTLGSKNETNRQSLISVAFPNKYLVGVNDGNNQTPTINGEVRDLKVATSSDASKRWLLDNEYKNTLVFYYWNYKQYVYYDNGWRYSSKGYEKVNESQLVKIEELTFLYPPTITITKEGNGYQVSLFAAEGSEIYYTTDGSQPVPGSSNTKQYTTPFFADIKLTIKAVAAKDGKSVSGVAEMCLPESHTVSLDDREEHNWTYYSGVDAGNYNTDYVGRLYSPNPRDVKITYMADGGAVSVSEPETEFEYYKTLEQGTTVGEYPYTVISNPFSKRPKGKGFGGWKIKSGHQYIKRANGTIATERDVLELDESITFINLPSDGTSIAKIEFQATWETAQITRLSAENANNTNYVFSKTVDNATTYENNFLIIDKFHSGTITVNSPCTIMMMEPDGSKDYRGFIFTGSIVSVVDGNTKIESAHWNPTATIDAKGRNFTIGRGMQMDGTVQHMFGSASSSDNVNQTLKVESGRFFQLRHYAENGDYGDRVTRQWVTLGCDYDRAKGDNTKLEFTGSMYVGHYCILNLEATEEMCRVYGLSGRFCTGLSLGTASYTQCYYMSVSDGYNQGHRYLEIQGGEWLNIAGGTNNYTPSTSSANYSNGLDQQRSFTFRMKGGLVKGAIYGGAEFYDAVGTRTYVITGGTIKGWVAGGANGTRTNGGQLYGTSYLYVGGNTRVDSNPGSNESSNTIINRAVGGNVFGAGCGYDATSTSGQVTLGTNVVIADNAYVERGVYGGGSYGFCSEDKASNIYITGGTIDGKIGGVEATGDSKKYITTINGGVYGGACQNKGGNVNIYMTGGTVNGGIYGGSNASGEVTGPITLIMTGGTVENVFGGGNEAPVTGNTNVTITGGEVKQNVYGGGNKATVFGTTNVVIGQ